MSIRHTRERRKRAHLGFCRESNVRKPVEELELLTVREVEVLWRLSEEGLSDLITASEDEKHVRVCGCR